VLAEREGGALAESENLAAALGWAHRSDTDRYLRLTTALGPYWLARGELAEGEVHLQSALDLVVEPTPARAAALVERTRLAGAASTVRADDLTGRELEIAELVAEGMTNRQIAARLYLSVRTVEGHVEHLRNKLGFATRARVAAWVAEKQVATT
jgi:DNA-binding NarL/FixJ family response regulator